MHLFKVIVILILIFSCATAPKEPVTDVVPLATEEEQAVASAVETMITSYNAQDIKTHVACYAPDARIDSALAGGFVTRGEYRQILQKMDRLPAIRLKDTKISKVSDDKYQVDTTLVGPRGSVYLIYELIPKDGRWLVIEQRYK